ncbi:MAG: RodZ domain-containing protein [Gammaproteobacteria bacterium]
MQETPTDKLPDGGGGTLGAGLRSAREARKLSVHKAAQDMHVSDDIIAALERDDYRTLGAPIFVRGHLRNYARMLGLSEDEVLAAYEHANSKLAPPPLVTQRPDGGSAFGRRVGMPVFSVVVIAVLVILAVTWWEHRSPGQVAIPVAQADGAAAANSLVAALPATATHVAAAGANVEAGGHETIPVSEPQVVMPRKVAPRGGAAVKPALKAQASELATARAVQAPSTAPVPGLPASALMHVKFIVSQASWIEVYDAAGKRLYYQLAPAGNNVNVSGAGPLQVFLGNSPGVSVELNGTPFNQAPFTQSDNTARFRLGQSKEIQNDANQGQAG